MTFDDERIARAYLIRVAEPPAPALLALVSEYGPVEAADRVKSADCPRAVLEETAGRRDHDHARRDLERAAVDATRLVIPEDHEWPARQLVSLATSRSGGEAALAPPLALWVRGPARLDEAVDQAIAIVGARAATAYGEHNAAELGYHLAGRGVPVFSGAAYGIDGATHRGALSADGTTVAVLPCGIDVAYPAGHATLLRSIGDSGALVSEYPPGTLPARHRFLVRNRILAALTSAAIVVEAGRRSGARNTATTAGALGKVVMAMPGPVSSGMSAGCHALIREGEATLVTSVDEILATAGLSENASSKLAAADDAQSNT
ncbi:DNA-processing protein DprA [Amycolatopsis sp. MJM2582]|uniref:DNA-processing protein DprA n=1 Tax=Amycolatopsis sp. MJM2582 TaxID=1427749 RepID=UPI0009E041D9|nr:DNA-processing protein DprA [Amycolatopsis sp. MJM2582]